ncbi:hypothetical protein ACFFJ4_18540 [Xanthomonas dyei]|uniref:hypothetical protein n=1 Tax=Xanthomonas dyei TaxID=743699 RepID=UPI001FD1EFBE|nr:hypothetical protein [Xanthomonas dyei]
MTNLVKLATARALVDASAVRQASVIGEAGAWTVQLQTHNQTRVLATKANAPRRFGSFESALKVLREMGMPLDVLHVDAAQWDTEDGNAKRRPDRSEAMKVKELDARYAVSLRTQTEHALADPRSALSSAQAKQQMETLKTQQRAALEAALVAKGTRA